MHNTLIIVSQPKRSDFIEETFYNDGKQDSFYFVFKSPLPLSIKWATAATVLSSALRPIL